MGDKCIVLVTGGCGCLGQHVIKLLQTRAEYVDEIRVLDIVPFEKKLEYEERVSVTSYTDDISKLNDTKAFQGVTSVFHLASIISVNNFPDYEGMNRVNVTGTENVLEACLKERVSRLIYASTVDVVCGYNDIVNGSEENTEIPEVLLYDGYAGTKLQAERMVLKYNGKPLTSGGVLQTVSLRPTVFFGELDSHYIPVVLQKARSNGGVFVQLGDGTALSQHSYVGNIAWAFICADQTLRSERLSDKNASDLKQSSDPQNAGISGEAFFITDDCEARGMALQVEPFLQAAGYRLSSYKLPFTPVYGSVKLAEGLLWLISPFVKIDLGFSSKSLRYINISYSYNNAKARRLLGYSAIYSATESIDLSNKYYLVRPQRPQYVLNYLVQEEE